MSPAYYDFGPNRTQSLSTALHDLAIAMGLTELILSWYQAQAEVR